MKAVWQDKFSIHNQDGKLIITGTIEASLKEAYEIHGWIDHKIKEMEDEQRKQLPIWKRILR